MFAVCLLIDGNPTIREPREYLWPRGGVAEWSKATVLKTVGLFRVSWVRIPPPPQVPFHNHVRGTTPSTPGVQIWRGGRVVEGARLLSE